MINSLTKFKINSLNYKYIELEYLFLPREVAFHCLTNKCTRGSLQFCQVISLVQWMRRPIILRGEITSEINASNQTTCKFTLNWWNFELTLFELTVHFKHGLMGIWQRFQRNRT